jgi:protein-tyrosine phosphatase
VDPDLVISFLVATEMTLPVGEVVPGLWVGGLTAVQEIANLPSLPPPPTTTTTTTPQNHHPQQRRTWTIISILHNHRLLVYVQRILTRQQKEKEGFIVQCHKVWNTLPDTCQTDFLGNDQLIKVLEIIDQGLDGDKGNVLIHCAQGISRSVTVCATWLISRRQYCTTLAQAMTFIRTVRPQAAPNLGFIAALRALEQCQGDITAAQERMRKHKRDLNRVSLS